MSTITRTYSFTDGTTAYGSQVDSEIANIVTVWNNHDAGTSIWTNIKTAALVFSPTTGGIKGTTTNDNTVAGNVGEYVESIVAAVNFAATTVYNDATSISLTAGDWDVSLVFLIAQFTNTTLWTCGISQTTGNSGSGLVVGSNALVDLIAFASAGNACATISNYRQSLSGTTTIYAKQKATYTGTLPVSYCRLSARRVR